MAPQRSATKNSLRGNFDRFIFEKKELPERRLRDLVSNKGLRYPYRTTVMRHSRADIRVLFALSRVPTLTHTTVTNKSGQEVLHLEKDEIEQVLCQLFDLAGDYLVSAGFPDDLPSPPSRMKAAIELLNKRVGKQAALSGEATIGAITLLKGIRKNFLEQNELYEGRLGWVKQMPLSMFVSFFLIVRSARLKWKENPSFPFEIEHHSKLAKMIDEFNEIAMGVEWGGYETILWLRDGRMILDPKEEENEGEHVEPAADEESHSRNVDEIAKITKAMSLGFDYDAGSLGETLQEVDLIQ